MGCGGCRKRARKFQEQVRAQQGDKDSPPRKMTKAERIETRNRRIAARNARMQARNASIRRANGLKD